MVTKQELRNYRSMMREILDLETELNAITDSRTARLSHTRSSGGGQDGGLDIPVSRIMEMEKLIQGKWDILTAERLRIEDALEVLQPYERDLIRLRYFHGCNWIQIQLRLGRSERWVFKHHGIALKKIS